LHIIAARNFVIKGPGCGIGHTKRGDACSDIARMQTLLASAASIQWSIIDCPIATSPIAVSVG